MTAIQTLPDFISSDVRPGRAPLAETGRSFENDLKRALEGRRRGETVTAGQGLTLRSGWDGPFAPGFRGADEVAEGLDLARAGLPGSFKKQVGLGLMALGRTGSSANSMKVGADLMGLGAPAEALKGLLESLGAEGAHLKLNKEALPELGQILADSGLDDETINKFLSEIAAGEMTAEQIFQGLAKLDLGSRSGGGLVVTAESLPALGQFLAGLGASAETVAEITSSLKPGDLLTAADLRRMLGGDDGLLSASLDQIDSRDLESMLKSMGLGDRDLKGLSTLLTQGRPSLGGLLDFLEGLETAAPRAVTGRELEMIKSVMENLVRDQQLAKTPVFNEILTKLQALGDREIDGDFQRLSPALQALRGGLSGQNTEGSAASGGQMGREGHPGQGGGDREAREHYRQVLHAQAGQDSTPAGNAQQVETLSSYGGQEALARQIAQKMAYSHRRGVRRLRMNLNPENLGRLDIELKVKDDRLVANIRAESREVYEALNGDLDSLREALTANGLDVANLTVTLDERAAGRVRFAEMDPALRRPEKDSAETPEDEIVGAAEASALRNGDLHRIV